MTASTDGRPDIRAGDLVRATRKGNPETTITGRAIPSGDGEYVNLPFHSASHRNWDFEVLDRPLPPIDKELLNDVINVWRKEKFGYGADAGASESPGYRQQFTAVINAVREYDRTHNKENA